jgi:hypothetical protein
MMYDCISDSEYGSGLLTSSIVTSLMYEFFTTHFAAEEAKTNVARGDGQAVWRDEAEFDEVSRSVRVRNDVVYDERRYALGMTALEFTSRPSVRPSRRDAAGGSRKRI